MTFLTDACESLGRAMWRTSSREVQNLPMKLFGEVDRTFTGAEVTRIAKPSPARKAATWRSGHAPSGQSPVWEERFDSTNFVVV